MCSNKVLFTKQTAGWIWPTGYSLLTPALSYSRKCCANHKHRMPRYFDLEWAFPSIMSLWACLLAHVGFLICNVNMCHLGECYQTLTLQQSPEDPLHLWTNARKLMIKPVNSFFFLILKYLFFLQNILIFDGSPLKSKLLEPLYKMSEWL